MSKSSLTQIHAERHGKAGRIEKALYDLGAIGQQKKCTAEDLMESTGIRTKRDLCIAVRRERTAGALICSTKKNGGGYYLPETKTEVETVINTLSKEARSLFFVLKAFRVYLREENEQEAQI